MEAAPGDYVLTSRPSEYTGFRSLSIEKVATIAKLIISEIGATFVTKMNKMMFYTDFIHYKNHGYGISGLTYRAMQFGPVPTSWSTIYGNLPGMALDEFVYPGGQSGIQMKNLTPAKTEILSEDEICTIKKVCRLFSRMSAGEISNVSHKEKAWIDNQKTHSEINYQDAFSLNYD